MKKQENPKETYKKRGEPQGTTVTNVEQDKKKERKQKNKNNEKVIFFFFLKF